MKSSFKSISELMTHAWVAASCIGLSGVAYGSQMGDLGLYSGYRQDSASFSICSTLSDPTTYGFAKVRARQIEIWEIGAFGSYRFTEDVSLIVKGNWGRVAGGRVRDSGVADINSNPWNAVVGTAYASCCDCACKPDICQCTCPDKTSRLLTPVQSGLTGNVWDFKAAVDYSFALGEEFSATPLIGYAYNQQRYKYRNASWGPIQVAMAAVPCASVVKGQLHPTNQDDLPEHATLMISFDELFCTGPNITSCFYPIDNMVPECVQFANCFDGTVYRASWNGGFIGLNLDYQPNDSWNLSLQYNFYLQGYSGRFSTFGGERNTPCDCNQCLTAFVLGRQYFSLDDRSDLPRQGFAGSVMRFGGWAYGQELALASEWRCNDWVVGLFGSVGYRFAPGCKTVSPCQSCTEIENGGLLDDRTGEINPVWSNAAAQGARWNSFQINANVAYLF